MPRRRIVAAGVIALSFAGLIAVAAWPAFTPRMNSGPVQIGAASQSPPPAPSLEQEPSSVPTPASEPPAARKDKAWFDRFIDREYPGYRILKLVQVPDQRRFGTTGMNYLLQNERNPKFKLAVTLWQFADEHEDRFSASEAFVDVIGDVCTTDAVFSATAARKVRSLAKDGQESIIDAYVAKKPSSTALVFWGENNETGTTFFLFAGRHAFDELIESGGGLVSDQLYEVKTSAPSGRLNSRVRVKIDKW